MDISHVLGRLYPAGVNYNRISGVTSDFTVSDISAALSYVPEGVGKVLLHIVYCNQEKSLFYVLMKSAIPLVSAEIRRQMHALFEANLEVMLSKASIQWGNNRDLDEKKIRYTNEQSYLDTLRQRQWPKNTVERIPLLLLAIIEELRDDRKCFSCFGKQVRNEIAGKPGCVHCAGTGVAYESNRKRAERIHCDQRDYLRRWKYVYEWIFFALVKELSAAKKIFMQNLPCGDTA